MSETCQQQTHAPRQISSIDQPVDADEYGSFG
jgi:hypothetical protein